MMVMMTAITPSEKASRRAVEGGLCGIKKDYQSIASEGGSRRLNDTVMVNSSSIRCDLANPMALA